VLSSSKVQFGREGYYLDITAAGRDHPGGLIEADGVWVSAGAANLGLVGLASPHEVRSVLAGIHPATGQSLLAWTDRREIAGFDLTLSASKTVSILHALAELAGSPETTAAVRAAHESAVRATISYLEGTSSRYIVRGPDGSRVLPGSGLIAVSFVHRSSRAPDPHLHSHVLVANLVLPLGGASARALDARQLFSYLRVAGALYETHLRFELTLSLGVEWDLKGVWGDIRGFPKEAIERFSRRAIEIEAVTQATGWTSPRGRQLTAYRTRADKDTSIPYEEVQQMWNNVRYALGLSDSRVIGVTNRVDGAQVLALETIDWEATALEALVSRSAEGTFSERDVITARCRAARSGAPVTSVVADATALVASRDVVEVESRPGQLRSGRGGQAHIPSGNTEILYTTAALAEALARVSDQFAGLGESLSVVTYEPTCRTGALDELSRQAGLWAAASTSVIALATNRPAAVSFEAATGIETFEKAGVSKNPAEGPDLARLKPGSVVVLADVHGYGPVVLENIVQSCQATGASLVLMGSASSIGPRPDLAAALKVGSRVQAFDRPSDLDVSAVARETLWPNQQFGDITALGVPTLEDALWEATRLAAAGAVAGADRAPIIVTGDSAVLRSLQDMQAALPVRGGQGRQEPMLTHARDLRRVLESLAESDGRRDVIVIGGTSVLHKAVGREEGVQRTHIVVMPQLADWSPSLGVTAEVTGRLAEAVRPPYLAPIFKRPGRDAAERDAQRTGAVLVEEWRSRYSVTDLKHAFGRQRAGGDGKYLTDQRAEDQRAVQRGVRDLGFQVGRQRGREEQGIGR
jgi:conjugative relaxase-like TrwC/TraI family protein